MIVEAKVLINGSIAAVWAAITEIADTETIVTGIMKIEMIDRPKDTLIGVRWRETRLLFDKPATVEKWITEATESAFTTRAEDGGFVFVTTHRVSESNGGVTLVGTHETHPQGLVAAFKAMPMFLFKGVIRKMILQDLNDIKSAVERSRPCGAHGI